LAGDLKLQNTEFVGQIAPANFAEVYDAADIFLNGSEIDNQPLSILEAFSCGLPVVTTDAGGIPDIVQDGRTGMVVSRGDHVEIANRALALLENPVLAKQIVDHARQECLKYSWEAVRDAWMSAYHGLANRGVQHAESETALADPR
jgi:glycosyltransferase involved in cell wall biosynthesis